jgi:uncharacterized repeat protein (TIGR03803 family)
MTRVRIGGWCSTCLFCLGFVGASPAQSTFFTTLLNFDWTDGGSPGSPLIWGTDRNFYGTTEGGGAHGGGTVFKIAPAGQFETLYSFCIQSECTDGAEPYDALVQASDGNFYGTTQFGGNYSNCPYMGCGTVFKITPRGALTTLYSFCVQTNCMDGANPFAALVQGSDGNFYGTTFFGGVAGSGTVFRITPAGALTVLHSFPSSGTDGALPFGGLVQASDGTFYGTTVGGGTYGAGTVFKITTEGTLTTLYSFCAQINCSDGIYPFAGLLQATDGNLYGTTTDGGTGTCDQGCGTIFKITPGGTLTTLHSFDGSDGDEPLASLIQASDGNFYGTTSGGGIYGNLYGTVFKINPAGALTTVHSFDGSDGQTPDAGCCKPTMGAFTAQPTLAEPMAMVRSSAWVWFTGAQPAGPESREDVRCAPWSRQCSCR